MTTKTGVRTFDHSLATTREWLNNVQEELQLENRQEAFVVARAVLHSLRDRMPVNEAAEFAAQLPMLLQGLYYQDKTFCLVGYVRDGCRCATALQTVWRSKYTVS